MSDTEDILERLAKLEKTALSAFDDLDKVYEEAKPISDLIEQGDFGIEYSDASRIKTILSAIVWLKAARESLIESVEWSDKVIEAAIRLESSVDQLMSCMSNGEAPGDRDWEIAAGS